MGNLPELSLEFDKGASLMGGAGSNLDVLAGGPPCQGFSGIGIRRSYSVDKADLLSNHLFVRMAHYPETSAANFSLRECSRLAEC